MLEICYLCGEEIPHNEISNDHVVPKQFIKRLQPKMKGFAYAGVLPSHTKCNNEFGPEKYSQKAIKIMKLLQDNKCISIHQNIEHPQIKIMAINSDCFSDFSKSDLEFFKISDVRSKKYDIWTHPDSFADKQKTDLRKDALFTALAVLTKSAAAQLLSKYHLEVPSFWRIVAIPYTGASTMDFDDIYGYTKPFEEGIKVWINKINNYAWNIIFKAEDIMVFFYFITSQEKESLYEVLNNYQDENAERFFFEGKQLNELIDYQWKII